MKKILFLFVIFLTITASAQYTPFTGVNYVKYLKTPPITTSFSDSILLYKNSDKFQYMMPVSFLGRKFIPLDGTLSLFPVTNGIEFLDGINVGLFSEGGGVTRQILFSDEQDVLIKSDTFGSSYGEFHVRSSSTESVVNDGTYTSNLFVGTDGVNVSATNPLSKGIVGAQDFSPNYDPLTYVQEKYVVPITGTRLVNPITGMLVSDYAGGSAHRSNVSTQFYAPGADSDEFSIYNASGFGINQDADGNSFNSVFPNFTGETGLSVLWRHPNTAGDYNYASEQYVDSAIGAIGGALVPYTGATSAVNLNNQNLENVNVLTTNGDVNVGEDLIVTGNTRLDPILNGPLYATNGNVTSAGTTGIGSMVVLQSSPALLGAPTAPTAAPNTNSTQLATTAYSDAKVADAITDGTTTIAPSQNAVFDALTLKANLASPALTGTPTVPTAADGTNSTQAASTAFVQSAVSAMTPVNDVTDHATINSISEQIVSSVLVAPSKIPSNAKLYLNGNVYKTGTGGTATIRVYYNDTNDLVTPTQVAQVSVGGTSTFVGYDRTFTLSGGNLSGYNGTSPSNTDRVSNTAVPFNQAYNNAANTYWILAVQLNVGTDVLTSKSFTVQITK